MIGDWNNTTRRKAGEGGRLGWRWFEAVWTGDYDVLGTIEE